LAKVVSQRVLGCHNNQYYRNRNGTSDQVFPPCRHEGKRRHDSTQGSVGRKGGCSVQHNFQLAFWISGGTQRRRQGISGCRYRVEQTRGAGCKGIRWPARSFVVNGCKSRQDCTERGGWHRGRVLLAPARGTWQTGNIGRCRRVARRVLAAQIT
jgi:hypothetical protein